jgi:Gpi18-like mannosyltransferase
MNPEARYEPNVMMRPRHAVAWLVGFLLASIPIRILLFDNYLDWDVSSFLSYIQQMHDKPFHELMATHFTKLSSAYLYLWYPLSFLEEITPSAFKGYMIVFDYACAWWCYRIVRLRYPSPSLVPLQAAALLVWVPVSAMTSSLWGQIDNAYTSFLLGCVFFLMRRQSQHARPHDQSWAILCFSAAFCFKLQAIVLVPALCFLVGARHLPWHYGLIPFLAYALMQTPRFLVGYPVANVFLGYQEQKDMFYDISVRAPNIYLLLGEYSDPSWHPLLDLIGTYTAVPLCLLAWLAGARLAGGKQLTPMRVLVTSLLSVTLTPYVLTRMHERYFYPADLLSVVLLFYRPQLWAIPFLTNVALTLSYLPRVATLAPYVFDPDAFYQSAIPYDVLILAMTVALCLVGQQWFRELKDTAQSAAEPETEELSWVS